MRTSATDRAGTSMPGPDGTQSWGRFAAWVPHERGPRRVAWIAGASVVLVVVSWIGLGLGGSSSDLAWISHGRAFAPEDAERLLQALAAKGIENAVINHDRVGVPASRRAEAVKITESLGLSWRSPKDVRDAPLRPSWLDGREESHRIALRNRERPIEAALERFPEIASASVVLIEDEARGFGRAAGLRAGLWLATRDNKPLDSDALRRVQVILKTWEPSLDPDQDVTVTDQLGRSYLVAGHERLAAAARAEGLADSWGHKIARELSWIEGVRVSVRLGPEEAPRPEAAPRAEHPARSAEPEVEVVVDGPADAGGASTDQTKSMSGSNQESQGQADVLVELPPTPGSGSSWSAQADAAIRQAVAHVVPPAMLGEVRIVKLPGAATAAAGGTTDSAETKGRGSDGLARAFSSLAPAWVGGLVVGGLMGLGLLVFGAAYRGRRRVPARPPATRPGGPIHVDRVAADDLPALTEHVRELVRRNPEAAAGVLQRWIGQGGQPA